MSSRTRGVRWWPGAAGWEHGGNPDDDAVMATAQARGIGYLGRLWSGTGIGAEYLDRVRDREPGGLTSWGAATAPA
jgi:mannan endo-1,4-beta-mannosidase